MVLKIDYESPNFEIFIVDDIIHLSIIDDIDRQPPIPPIMEAKLCCVGEEPELV